MMNDIDGCDCTEEQDEHMCPYKEDIGGDSESLCTCCVACEEQCRADI